MEFVLLLAAKSLLIAGGTLLLLKLMQRRSAADRSWIAHLGLAAVLLLPLGSLALPALQVAGPAFLSVDTAEAAAPMTDTVAPVAMLDAPEVAPSGSTFPGAGDTGVASPIDWAFWAYAAPAGLLILLTLIALLRLVVLKSRANVLVDTHWLTALAQAQRRMGFKNGTALLTSDDLSSPVSWGLMRPVILLNTDATKAKGEAEAIIAHELAHVARLDWAKLMLARVAVALFWFNPLVWLLAREAHQLREEAADDAVLAADIEDTEYANLLVGIARHECRGLLLGAHGVAPARNSLTRRVRRVLDAALERAPGGWRWSSAAAFFAAGMTVPVAALQFVNPSIATAAEQGRFVADASAAPAAAAGAATAGIPGGSAWAAGSAVLQQPNGATITNVNGQTILRSPDGGTITLSPPDAKGRRHTVLKSASGSAMAFADARAVPGLAGATALAAHPHKDAIDRAVELKALGADRNYVQAIRNAAPHLRLDHDEIIQLKALGVSPAYLRELASSGYPRLDADAIAQARAIGVTGAYIRSMASAGYGHLPMGRLVELKAVGVTAADIARYRRAGGRLPSVNRIVELKALGITPEDLEAADSP